MSGAREVAMFKPQNWLDRVFEIGIIAKGLNGAVELLSGLLLLFVSPAWIHHIAVSLTRVELSEDPHDSSPRTCCTLRAA
jgi:uncharacterized membrane protein